MGETMDTTVKILPDLSTMVLSTISLILYIAIIGLVIFMLIKIPGVIKDIRKIREDMDKVVEILEKED